MPPLSRSAVFTLLALLLVSACSGVAPSARTVTKSGGLQPNATSTIAVPAAAAVAIAGTVHAPAGLISNDGGSIIAQGGGNIIAQGGGNVIAQGGGNFIAQAGADGTRHLLGLAETPLANTAVYVTDRSGRILPGTRIVKSDAKGNFTLHVPASGAYQIVALAKSSKGEVKLATLTRAGSTGVAADVSAASTMVTAALVAEATGALGDFDPATFQQAIDVTASHLSVESLPDMANPAALRAFMKDLSGHVAELGSAMTRMNSQLAAINSKLDELQHALDKLNATPTPAPVSSVQASTTPIGPPSALPLPTPSVALAGPLAFVDLPAQAPAPSGPNDNWGTSGICLQAPAGGGLWIDSMNGFTQVQPLNLGYATDNLQPGAATFDTDGTLWIADRYANTLVRLTPDLKYQHAKWLAGSARGGTATGVAVATDHSVWFTAVGLVARFDLSQPAPKTANPGSSVGPIAAAAKGNVWVAVDGNVLLMDATQTVVATLALVNVNAIVSDGAGNAWCHYANGLARLDGVTNTVTTVKDSSSFYRFTVDSDGACWAVDVTSHQIQRFLPTGLRDGAPKSFTGNFQGIAATAKGQVTVVADNHAVIL